MDETRNTWGGGCQLCINDRMKVYMREYRKTHPDVVKRKTPEQRIAKLEAELEKERALAEKTSALDNENAEIGEN